MPTPPVRVLCTGDLHVGRFPSYAPPGDRSLSVESTWSRAVEWAVEQAVDAVVLTGDVADQDNKVFEAFGPLKAGVERLAAAGIRTFAVAGNHDYDALHRLADLLDPSAFTLLGPSGTWSTASLERDGIPVLRLIGWSFPDRYVRSSPLDAFPPIEDDLPVLGVLHADLDQADSPYAPVRSMELAAAPVAAWLLGHIHRPSFNSEEGRGLLYPGSLQPLDPGEQGAHGPWLVTVDADGSVTADHHPLASIRYDEVAVDLAEAEDRKGAEAAIIDAITAHLRAAGDTQPEALLHVLDVRLHGRTPLHGALARIAADLAEESFPEGRATGVVRHVAVETRPAYDLRDLARRKDPAGAVAQLVLDVEAGDAGDAVAEAARTVEAVDNARAYAPLRRAGGARSDGDAGAEASALLVEQGLLLLDRLLRQHEAHQAS